MRATTPTVTDQLIKLSEQVGEGEISVRQALERARELATTGARTDETAVGLSEKALDIVRKNWNSWRAAVTLHALLNVILDPLGADKEPTAADCEVAFNWTTVVAMALWQVPDPPLYKDALARGTCALAWLKANGTPNQVGNFLHALGTLHLDPYVAMRNSMSIAQELRSWRARAWEGQTWDGERHGDLVQEGYPSAEEALVKAREYYSAAITVKSGRDRAISLKALAQTLYGYKLFGLEEDRDGLVSAAREALQLLNPKQDPTLVAELSAYLTSAGAAPADVQVPKEWLDQSLDASIFAHGEEATRAAVVQVASSLLDKDPRLALRLLVDAQPLFKADPSTEHYSGFHVLTLRAFQRVHGWRAGTFGSAAETSTMEHAEAMRDKAQREDWDPARFAAGLGALAEYSGVRNEEAVGVRLLDHMIRVAPVATASLTPSYQFFRAQLLLNEGVNAVNQGDWDRATQYYSAALAGATELRAVTMLVDLLDRLGDVVQRGGLDAATSLLTTLMDRTDAVEVAGGQAATERLQALYRLTADTILEHKGDSGWLWLLLQLAKGRRFAAAIVAGSAQRITDEDRDGELLAKIAQARKEAEDTDSADSPDLTLAPSILLSPYSRASLQLSGDGALERMANLEHRFDIQLHDRLVLKSAGTSGLLATEDAVRAALDDDTVLLQYYFPTSLEGDTWLMSALTTREGSAWAVVRIDGKTPTMRLTIDGAEVEHSYATTLVNGLREAVNEDPGTGALSDGARKRVAQASDLLLSGIADRLADYRTRGKSHLCVVPNGALAYAPMHLLGLGDRTLSEDWTVTYLPSLQLLANQRGGPALQRHRPRSLAAFGLCFIGDTHGYPELPQAGPEAQAVAQAWKTTATLNENATESAVRTALLDSRFVHIATHGAHRPIAPSFHMFRLAPDGQDDGDFYAYELLGMDLRGLELVTLSACDTALGRFDAGDNPQGLPANLFLAGVQTIIGSLWQAEDNASEYFFTTLYKGLAAEMSKLDAFRHALSGTRELHPQFRDWGAFYFAGSWR